MKTHAISLALAFVLIFPFASAQWVQTNGPYGGRITSFAVSGSNLFAGTYDGGVYRSTNGGTSWTNLSGNGLTTITDYHVAPVTALLTSGGRLYAGAEGVYVSTNNGATWTEVSQGLGGKGVVCLASNGSTLYAGKSYFDLQGDCSVYRSTNNGSSWTPAGAGLTDPVGNPRAVNALVISESLLVAGSFGVFVSSNDGDSWTSANSGLIYQDGYPPWVKSLFVDGANLLAGTSQGVFLSTNNGTTWTMLDTSVERRYANAFARIGTNLFVSASDLFFSTDNGGSWGTAKHGWVGGIDAIATSGTDLYVGTGGAGVFLSTDKGTSWTPVSNGLSYLSVNTFSVRGANLYAGTQGAGVFLSSDNGASWIAVNTGLSDGSVSSKSETNRSSGMHVGGSSVLSTSIFTGPPPGIYVDALLDNGTNLLAGTTHGLFRSTNDGTSWTRVSASLPYSEVNALTTSGPNLFAVSSLHYGGPDGGGALSGAIVLSTDNGTNWSAVGQGLPRDSFVDTTKYQYVSCLASCGQNLFAGAGGGIFVSTNNGANWTESDTGLPVPTSISSFVVSGKYIYANTRWKGVFLSTDNGARWIGVNNGLLKNPYDTTQYEEISAIEVKGTNVFVGVVDPSTGKSGRIFLSTDNGKSWTAVDNGFEQSGIVSLIVSGKDLFAGIGGNILTNGEGVWRRPLSDLVSVKLSSRIIPAECTLSQNYPNPFNPSTTIKYTVGGSRHQASGVSEVRLVVYDLLGREVAVLVNERKAPGNYEVTLNGSNLGTGIYFYRLQAGDYVASKKMLVLK